MTGDEYIQHVLAKYAVPYGPDSPAIRAANAVAPAVRRWAGDLLVELMASGSYAKGTAIAGGTDIDVFISLKPTAPTLQEIYRSLAQLATDRGWNPRAQNVSMGITYNGAKIDLVPGRQQQGYKNYHSLWRRKAGTWTQTNVALHIDRVRDSGRTGEIRAMKIWRRNHGLDDPLEHKAANMRHISMLDGFHRRARRYASMNRLQFRKARERLDSTRRARFHGRKVTLVGVDTEFSRGLAESAQLFDFLGQDVRRDRHTT